MSPLAHLRCQGLKGLQRWAPLRLLAGRNLGLSRFKDIFTNALRIMALYTYIEIEMAPRTAVKIQFSFYPTFLILNKKLKGSI
jgi:hypothetical protein